MIEARRVAESIDRAHDIQVQIQTSGESPVDRAGRLELLEQIGCHLTDQGESSADIWHLFTLLQYAWCGGHGVRYVCFAGGCCVDVDEGYDSGTMDYVREWVLPSGQTVTCVLFRH